MVERNKFPYDDDGEVLYRLALGGMDLSKPEKIEFYCYVSDLKEAEGISEELSKLGFDPDVFDDAEASTQSHRFSVYSTKIIIPSYKNIIREQNNINAILEKYRTVCDGWGVILN